jgi:hypothetical protein
MEVTTEVDSEAKAPTRMHRLQRTNVAPKKTAKAPTTKVAAGSLVLKPKAAAIVKPVTPAASRVLLASRARKGDQQAINELMRNGRAKPRPSKNHGRAAAAGKKPVAVVQRPAAVAAKRPPAAKKARFRQRKASCSRKRLSEITALSSCAA